MFGFWELALSLRTFPLAIVVAAIFYLVMLQRLLNRCSEGNRTMNPGMVWLLLVPVFNLYWQFFVVSHVRSSLEKEFESREKRLPKDLTVSLGLALSTCWVSFVVVFWAAVGLMIGGADDIYALNGVELAGRIALGVSFFVGVATVVLWAVYWTKLSDALKVLEPARPFFPASYPPPQSYSQQYGQPYGPQYGQPYGQQYGPPANPQLHCPPQWSQQPPPMQAQGLGPQLAPPFGQGPIVAQTGLGATQRYCANCGAALAGGPFCSRCGVDQRSKQV